LIEDSELLNYRIIFCGLTRGKEVLVHVGPCRKLATVHLARWPEKRKMPTEYAELATGTHHGGRKTAMQRCARSVSYHSTLSASHVAPWMSRIKRRIRFLLPCRRRAAARTAPCSSPPSVRLASHAPANGPRYNPSTCGISRQKSDT